jgi:membrane protein YqaA with SNARE-associated domain
MILSMLKYQFCLITASVAQSWILLLLSLLGGVIGIVIFTQIGYDLEKWLVKRFPKWFKRFSLKNRILVRIRRNWGIWGISFLTPILLGIPVGIALCLTLTTDKRKIIKPMILSLVCWTLIFLVLVLLIGK